MCSPWVICLENQQDVFPFILLPAWGSDGGIVYLVFHGDSIFILATCFLISFILGGGGNIVA